MAILDNTTTDEVLRQLTHASWLERFYHSAEPDVRKLAEADYREAYDWLQARQVPFVYDQEQRCYVVEVPHAE